MRRCARTGVGWVRLKAVTQHLRRDPMLGYALRANPTYDAHMRSPGKKLACFTHAASCASSSRSSSWMSMVRVSLLLDQPEGKGVGWVRLKAVTQHLQA